MNKKSVISVIAALCAAVAVLWLLTALLMPKYMTESQEGAMIEEYYAEAGGHDVIFVGDCEIYENFSPKTFWENYGITTYFRGSAQQLIWQSYYLMEETFKYETPDVMVFNVLSMKYDTPASTGAASQREAYNRMTLDGMKWSSSKWNAIDASMTELEKEAGGKWLYLFPLLRYHDRWCDLTAEDFRYMFRKETLTDNGYLMQVGIKPLEHEHMEKPLVDYNFSENCWMYLDMMRQLCEENGSEFVLIKAPALSPVWWDEWDAQIEAYAAEHDLLYINFLDHLEEMDIDWSLDTYDTGLHLNVYGAEKAADYFGKILVEEFDLTDHRTEADTAALWAEKVETYNTRKAKLEALRDGQ